MASTKPSPKIKSAKAARRRITDKQRKISEKSLANLKPFQKNDPETGAQDERINREGRPKHTVLSDAYRHMLGEPMPKDLKLHVEQMIESGEATFADVFAYVMANRVLKGSDQAIVEIRKATEGDKVSQTHRGAIAHLTSDEMTKAKAEMEQWESEAFPEKSEPEPPPDTLEESAGSVQ